MRWGSGGRGGMLTQASGVVKRLRVGSTDCVGLYLAISSHTHTLALALYAPGNFSPRVSFELLELGLCLCKIESVCIYGRTCAHVSCRPNSLHIMDLCHYSPNFC